ncbi:MAG TPA: TetR/AcrR family transcriptional regulator [Thermoanaerobaculia bacterium]|nr:TetR/AcrR family transcriptional regulator [Thermoanaerobaculia bacterium]
MARPTKGEATRRAILDRAVLLATESGLEGLTIGRLAEELGLSKSGLFAHFRSKEALQIQVLDAAAERFVDEVVKPAVRESRGEPRVKALFERWLGWAKSNSGPGGCLFVAAAAELDDRPGPVRDRLVELQKGWLDTIGIVYRTGVDEGHFRADADPGQFTHDLYSVMLGYHHAWRLMRDPRAEERARAAFERLLSSVRTHRLTA